MTVRSATAGVDIAAPPERVWDLITDITLMPRFSTELQHAEWAEGFDAPALGAQFLGTNRHPAIGEWTTRSHIVDFDPPRVFGWAVGDPGNAAATWQFDLSAAPGGSRLRYTACLGPGPSGVTMLIERKPDRAEQIIANRLDQLQAAIETTLAGLRALAEGAT